jgi:hypothetical protein
LEVVFSSSALAYSLALGFLHFSNPEVDGKGCQRAGLQRRRKEIRENIKITSEVVTFGGTVEATV